MCVTDIVFDSSVALVVKYGKGVRVIGSGVLFKAGERKFVVTAAHVVKGETNTIGISNKGSTFVPVEKGGYSERFDLGICEISNQYADKFSNNSFVDFDQIECYNISESAVFTFIGYPSVWVDQDNVVLKPFQFTSFRFTESIPGYSNDLNLFINAPPAYNTNEEGEPMPFKSREGMHLNFPKDLRGISGCGVWIIGDLNVPVELWQTMKPKLVGIETSVFDKPKAINVVKWIAVNTIIKDAFPELESSFVVYQKPE